MRGGILKTYSKVIQLVFAAMFLSILISSCSPLLKIHHEINPMSIAVLKIYDNKTVGVDYIDEEEVQSFPRKWIFEVLPGQHVVQVNHKDWGQEDSPHDKPRPILVKFKAIPQHLYLIEYHMGSHYSGAEIDDVTDEASKAVKARKDMEKWNWAEEYINKWQLK
jgi:hypothetical protein